MRLRGPPFLAFRRRLPACSTRRSTCRPFGLAPAVRRRQVRQARVLLHTAVGRCDRPACCGMQLLAGAILPKSSISHPCGPGCGRKRRRHDTGGCGIQKTSVFAPSDPPLSFLNRSYFSDRPLIVYNLLNYIPAARCAVLHSVYRAGSWDIFCRIISRWTSAAGMWTNPSGAEWNISFDSAPSGVAIIN